MSKKVIGLLSSALVWVCISQAHAANFNCRAQSISHKSLDYLELTNRYGDFYTIRYSIDDQKGSEPTLLPESKNDEYDYVSHDGDIAVSLPGGFIEESVADEVYNIHLKIKSLGINGTVECNGGF